MNITVRQCMIRGKGSDLSGGVKMVGLRGLVRREGCGFGELFGLIDCSIAGWSGGSGVWR